MIRRQAVELWGNRLPVDPYEKLARILFCCDNPPGTDYISGAQDAIGIVFPGLARPYYKGAYWPTRIDHCLDGKALDFVEQALYLKPLGPRHAGYDVLSDTRIDEPGARYLAEATECCWQAILEQDIAGFGASMRQAFEGQIAMFPHMMNPGVQELIDQFRDRALGWKLSGAGGGGYLIFVADGPIEHSVRVVVRREQE